MNLSAATQRSPAARSCAACSHFRSDPRELEASIPGLRSFGSGYASVRADDGLCTVHDRYLSAASFCASFAERPGVTAQNQRNAS